MAILFLGVSPRVQAKSYIAYISDSTNSSVIYWIAKEAGILKKHGLDLDMIFINGSVRGIQSLIAGDLKQTLEVQALTDSRASKYKAEDFIERRFVDELRKSGFVDKLYGRKRAQQPVMLHSF